MSLTIVAYGAGTNSTAILAGLHERGERPDAIVFADTVGERPEIYAHIEAMQGILAAIGFPRIDVVKGASPRMVLDGSLEAECIRLETLPSKAFGFSSCSMKWKLDPQRKYFRAFAEAHGVPLESVMVLIGFDADEPSRVERGMAAKNPTLQRYPLYEWGWGREECVEAIGRQSWPQPGKSACFYCPSSKKPEILELRRTHPDLMARALAMESRALAGGGVSAAGLGRKFSWGTWLAEYDAAAARGQAFIDAQPDLFSNAGVPEQDCGCIDG